MFGFVVADAEALSEAEKDRYRALYCGLCFALRDRYGQLSRACLTYDLTFFVMLCASLHEPAETCGESHCVMHPAPRAPRPWARSEWTDYAADLTVALAYHKVLDDIADDGSAKARAAERLLAGAYRRAQERIPEQCAEIERAMTAIRAIEQSVPHAVSNKQSISPIAPSEQSTPHVIPSERSEPRDPLKTPALFPDPDAAAREFGLMLGRLFAHDQGFWADGMEALGAALGRFIYLMDAAVDFAADAASGSYNPFVTLQSDPETMRTTLALTAADVADAYERLPLVQDAHLMDSILYSGIWAQFNRTYPATKEDPQSESSNKR